MSVTDKLVPAFLCRFAVEWGSMLTTGSYREERDKHGTDHLSALGPVT